MSVDRRRSLGRRYDDTQAGPALFTLFLGFAYGFVVAAVLYTWVLPLFR